MIQDIAAVIARRNTAQTTVTETAYASTRHVCNLVDVNPAFHGQKFAGVGCVENLEDDCNSKTENGQCKSDDGTCQCSEMFGH